MVPSELVVKSIKERILKGDRTRLILLDGFPRSADNIAAWDKIVGD